MVDGCKDNLTYGQFHRSVTTGELGKHYELAEQMLFDVGQNLWDSGNYFDDVSIDPMGFLAIGLYSQEIKSDGAITPTQKIKLKPKLDDIVTVAKLVAGESYAADVRLVADSIMDGSLGINTKGKTKQIYLE